MTKCKIIDRIAYTRGEVKFLDNSQHHKVDTNNDLHGEICPECGRRSLLPEAGCWSCKSCGYSKCDVRR